jgi:7-cyano-7-deazaguanine synthase in queuosine biosynthesis
MKMICAPASVLQVPNKDTRRVVLYGPSVLPEDWRAGAVAKKQILRAKLNAAPRAWDFLSLALSVVSADLMGLREKSPDGWTREFELQVAVSDPAFWSTQASEIEAALAFLSTDRWRIHFVEGGLIPEAPVAPTYPEEDCIVLVSGGLDSLIGLIDRVADGKKPFVLSQTVRGDAEKQSRFAGIVGGGLSHLQLNHNANGPGKKEPSQRARSMIFIAFGVLVATALASHHDGETVPLYLCENGFIALNPPLTGARVGSLSTRTAHPEYLTRLQNVLDAADIRVKITNPYEHRSKGEMLLGCKNQLLLNTEAHSTTSCGRFLRFGYRHCGRCVPCQVRRAAFVAAGMVDKTEYVYENLGANNSDCARFDDVQSVAMAIAEIKTVGLDRWLGSAMSYPKMVDTALLRAVVERGFNELSALHTVLGVG